jgi:Kef-type K+ transport system membrane component KefB
MFQPQSPLPNPLSKSPRTTIAGYAVMLLVAIGLFFVVRSYGETLPAPVSEVNSATPADAATVVVSHPLLHLLLALLAVIAVGRALATVFAYVGQPPVIGEVLGGICLGPSLLGRVWPEASAFVLPPSVAPSLSVVAQLGVILYMFVVGLHLNAGMLRKQGHVTLAISHASIVVPFSLGAILALWLYPMLAPGGVSFTAFALFLSVSMSITAFPVLARILTDRALHKTELGVIALACAAVDDVSAWCLLALVVGVVQSKVEQAMLVTLLAVAYVVVMFWIVRPLVTRAVARYCPEGLTTGAFGMILGGMLLSALATEAIGIHAIFGAFLFGAALPHDGRIANELTDKMERLVTTLLLPAFFAFVGMRTEIGLLNGPEQWLVCLAIIAVATLGKFGGTLGAARWSGLGWRDSASLGILMNTRGLMELIVLNVGLDLGVISPTLFAMMVLMAIVTTVATSPILRALMREAEPKVRTSPASSA